ncbi:NAD(P)H-dependent oxidoreductase [Spongiactinospora sp. TRM90649]|uniref:NADPH-dependent FMN reductase n=1 Tax=Spongiactinospora sp. TRM90649 TaxID=3031114 RepID=UPI0023F9BB86|nr:NAD(P)H-dependent oxidoreductase [Spongiactinospora sp. TRM90649]MDF5757472.1 NAD(P)H-dependent oxidoreductase [Spongiactinospora sp. TRM90649]
MPEHDRLRLAIIIGSTRKGRFGPTVARWFATRARRTPGLEVDLIDLAEARLPDALCDVDDDVPPAVRRLAPRLDAADAFVIVTPEYNLSFPAPLKTAIDWYLGEWRAKPVAFVSYGRESGGLHAVAQLRQVFTELHAVPLRDGVSLPCYWERFAADGSWPRPGAVCEDTVRTVLERLCWWARALREARRRQPFVA